MKAVILAGGKGTRLGILAATVPKPMVKICGRPILEYQVELLKRHGITDITIITGHLGDVIENHFRDGSHHGVHLSYFRETVPLGTTGGIREIGDRLTSDFMVLYGDVMVDMDLERLVRFHRTRGGMATLVLHPNDHPLDSDLVELDAHGRVLRFHAKPHDPPAYYHNMVNAALYVLSPDILPLIPRGRKADFGKDIFPLAVETGTVYGYVTGEYLKDVGTPERVEEVTRDCRSGKIRRLNRRNGRRAVFLDRDGVLLRKVPYLHTPDEVELYPFTGEALREINGTELLAVLVTNQPVVARGMCTMEELDDIHKKMEWLLGSEGAKLDGIYVCPHHPHAGYPGEVSELKISCSCRKPETGMIDRAAEDFNIERPGSYMVGDSFRDIECGRRAGLITIGVMTGDGCKDLKDPPDHMARDLRDAVRIVLRLEASRDEQ